MIDKCYIATCDNCHSQYSNNEWNDVRLFNNEIELKEEIQERGWVFYENKLYCEECVIDMNLK